MQIHLQWVIGTVRSWNGYSGSAGSTQAGRSKVENLSLVVATLAGRRSMTAAHCVKRYMAFSGSPITDNVFSRRCRDNKRGISIIRRLVRPVMIVAFPRFSSARIASPTTSLEV